jgi:lysine/ornithine N-monooxygenase
VNLGFDPNTLRIFNADNDTTSSVIGNGASSADVFADLRRRNTAAAKKADAEVKGIDQNKNIKDLSALTSLVRR